MARLIRSQIKNKNMSRICKPIKPLIESQCNNFVIPVINGIGEIISAAFPTSKIFRFSKNVTRGLTSSWASLCSTVNLGTSVCNLFSVPTQEDGGASVNSIDLEGQQRQDQGNLEGVVNNISLENRRLPQANRNNIGWRRRLNRIYKKGLLPLADSTANILTAISSVPGSSATVGVASAAIGMSGSIMESGRHTYKYYYGTPSSNNETLENYRNRQWDKAKAHGIGILANALYGGFVTLRGSKLPGMPPLSSENNERSAFISNFIGDVSSLFGETVMYGANKR